MERQWTGRGKAVERQCYLSAATPPLATRPGAGSGGRSAAARQADAAEVHVREAGSGRGSDHRVKHEQTEPAAMRTAPTAAAAVLAAHRGIASGRLLPHRRGRADLRGGGLQHLWAARKGGGLDSHGGSGNTKGRQWEELKGSGRAGKGSVVGSCRVSGSRRQRQCLGHEGSGNTQGKGSVLATRVVETQGKGKCLSHEGSGNNRQGQ